LNNYVSYLAEVNKTQYSRILVQFKYKKANFRASGQWRVCYMSSSGHPDTLRTNL